MILKQNKIVEHIHNIFTISCEKCEMVSFVSSIMENTVAPVPPSRFPVKLVACIVFG